jgi:hypothetical protein
MFMGRLIITESEKEEILNKYNNENTDKQILTFLKRHFPVSKPFQNSKFFDEDFMKNRIMIKIDDKLHSVDDNKKSLVNRLFNEIDDVFPGVDVSLKRRTIKKFVDLILTSDF